MADPTLFEEPLLEDLEEEVTAALGSVYRAPVIKKVLDFLRDSTLTPFQVAVTVTPCPCICSFLFFTFTYGFLPFYLWVIVQMSVFWACMAKCCDARQHQLN